MSPHRQFQELTDLITGHNEPSLPSAVMRAMKGVTQVKKGGGFPVLDDLLGRFLVFIYVIM